MLVSRLSELLAQLDLPRAARAMGEAAVGCVRWQMQHGYAQPIFATGALMNDVSFVTDGTSVTIGSTLPYASAVHDGTFTQPARPYLADGILGSISTLRDAAANALR